MSLSAEYLAELKAMSYRLSEGAPITTTVADLKELHAQGVSPYRIDLFAAGCGFLDQMEDGKRVVYAVHHPSSTVGCGARTREAWDDLIGKL